MNQQPGLGGFAEHPQSWHPNAFCQTSNRRRPLSTHRPHLPPSHPALTCRPGDKNKTGKNSCQFGKLPSRWETCECFRRDSRLSPVRAWHTAQVSQGFTPFTRACLGHCPNTWAVCHAEQSVWPCMCLGTAAAAALPHPAYQSTLSRRPARASSSACYPPHSHPSRLRGDSFTRV